MTINKDISEQNQIPLEQEYFDPSNYTPREHLLRGSTDPKMKNVIWDQPVAWTSSDNPERLEEINQARTKKQYIESAMWGPYLGLRGYKFVVFGLSPLIDGKAVANPSVVGVRQTDNSPIIPLETILSPEGIEHIQELIEKEYLRNGCPAKPLTTPNKA